MFNELEVENLLLPLLSRTSPESCMAQGITNGSQSRLVLGHLFTQGLG